MAIYAKAPEGVDPEWTDYITPGKEYLVSEDRGLGFNSTADTGSTLYCLWCGCAHLSPDFSLDWERIEREDDA